MTKQARNLPLLSSSELSGMSPLKAFHVCKVLSSPQNLRVFTEWVEIRKGQHTQKKFNIFLSCDKENIYEAFTIITAKLSSICN